MKAIIVDDEPKARRILRSYLNKYCIDIEILTDVSNVSEAVVSINKYKPELVFLDIEMPGQDGFALFSYFEKIDFQIIFVTASRDHAIDAFKVSALDYILKPINIEELKTAVDKAKKTKQFMIKERVNDFNKNIIAKNINRIALSLDGCIEFIKLEEIQYLKADGSYTEFYLDNGKKILSSKPISEYSFLEKQTHFMKTHRSFLVNLQKVRKYLKDSGGYIIMTNGNSTNLSRYKKNEFIEAMERI